MHETPATHEARQRATFAEGAWSDVDRLPYPKRRDRTFGQYAANLHLIRLEPFADTLSGKSAVTVCDGRGVEASYLGSRGLRVTATDLCATTLAEKKAAGTLDTYAEENAESLSFADASFDWGMVKAGLHHLARPWKGVYELLRVAREGVLVIEGNDGALLRCVRHCFCSARDWEPSGNYVYRFRVREFEKTALSLGLPAMAWHAAWMPWRGAYERIPCGTPGYAWRKALFAAMSAVFGSQGNALAVLLFKQPPTPEQVAILRAQGFRYKKLPGNPHTTGDTPSERQESATG